MGVTQASRHGGTSAAMSVGNAFPINSVKKSYRVMYRMCA